MNLPVGSSAGRSSQWGEALPLRRLEARGIEVDLAPLSFADPLFLIRLRAFMEWHAGHGSSVHVVPPTSREVSNYLARMGVAVDLPEGCSCPLSDVRAQAREDVLISLTRLLGSQDSDDLELQIATLLDAHFGSDALGGLFDPFFRTVSEMCDNAMSHGQSRHGAFVAAQRYQNNRCVLAIGDLGVGIPSHLRRKFPHLVEDGQAIAEATREGVTGTDDRRGNGYYWVVDAMRKAAVPRGRLEVWSGRGRLTMDVQNGEVNSRLWPPSQADWRLTEGTWVRLGLETA